MSPRVRLGLFGLAALASLPVLGRVSGHMPAFGAHPIPYGDAIAASAPVARQTQNLVTALNFDYRGFDTLGEEFILLCAVTGVSVLLRGTRGETDSARPGRVDNRPVLPAPEAVTLLTRPLGIVTVVFALSLSLHASTTPGGGFQGGVLIAAGLLLTAVGEGYRGWRRMVRSEAMDGLEAAGALLYVLCGFAGLLVGAPFMANVLPFGTAGGLWSGGLILVINAGVLMAVTGAFAILFLEFLEETRIDPGLEDGES